MDGENAGTKKSQRVKHRRRATLFAKELRQNAGIMAGLLCLFIILLFTHCFGLHFLGNSGLLVLYVAVFCAAAVLGSAFLAEENASGSVNFLLRLPVPRQQLFSAKLLSQLALLAIGLVFALLLSALLQVCLEWEWDFRAWEPRQYWTALLWIPLVYFLAACFSVCAERAIVAFLAAMAFGAMFKALCQDMSITVSQWIAGGPPVEPPLAHVVSNVLLTCMLGAVVGLFWWLFLSKEGR